MSDHDDRRTASAQDSAPTELALGAGGRPSALPQSSTVPQSSVPQSSIVPQAEFSGAPRRSHVPRAPYPSGGSASAERVSGVPPNPSFASHTTLSPPPSGQLKQVTVTATDATDPGTPAPSAADGYVGFVIDGRYDVEQRLAKGGMGVVYRARHRILNKLVAIKVLRTELLNNRDVTQRFLTEAKAASSIGSGHIVDVIDYGELPDGATYIVMEYLEGVSLAQQLELTPRLAEPLLIAIAKQLVEGLEQAHKAQIIHRDLKPDNVFLVRQKSRPPFVKILDFGIAKVASNQNRITRAGRVFGTPYYMSPEQANGAPLDGRSDIYALGVMLFEMASGQLPFDGDNPLSILTQHICSEPPTLGSVAPHTSVALEAIVGKCLSKNQDHRYGSMRELGDDLDRLDYGLSPLALDDMLARPDVGQALKERMRRQQGAVWKRRAFKTGGWLALTAVALLIGQQVYSRTLGSEPTVPASAGPTQQPNFKSVALVLSPIDAHVFQDDEDLGMMPINIRLRPGDNVTLEVRRDGFTTREIKVDGSESRLVIALEPDPGSTPSAKNTPPQHDTTAQAGAQKTDRPRTITFESNKPVRTSTGVEEDGPAASPEVPPPKRGAPGPAPAKQPVEAIVDQDLPDPGWEIEPDQAPDSEPPTIPRAPLDEAPTEPIVAPSATAPVPPSTSAPPAVPEPPTRAPKPPPGPPPVTDDSFSTR